MSKLIDIFLHLDAYLNTWATDLGAWLYAILFTVIFAETGLVVTPFLPGDSLLFAVGALAASEGSPINVGLVLVLLSLAGILGDATNYAIGRILGPKVFKRESSWLLNKKHLERTQHFYERHGGKTIILARFVPIVRTFAPFVAGIGQMRYRRFASFNVVGAIAWVGIFVIAGYAFGLTPVVKRNFQLVIIGIILVSVLPIAIEIWRARRASKAAPVAQPVAADPASPEPAARAKDEPEPAAPEPAARAADDPET
ncbi:MAG: DedA family protein [Myxococcales bacterium]|nr:DedA family protein [Myxococcales bacterium]